MKIVLQRVSRACVSVDNEKIGSIGRGIVLLVGIKDSDTEKDIEFLSDKCIHLRIFPDENDKMNLSIKDIKGEILVVSQFTLYGDCRKGRRPSFSNAALPQKAEELYNKFVIKLKESGLKVETGKFQAKMLVEINNDGPVTFILES